MSGTVSRLRQGNCPRRTTWSIVSLPLQTRGTSLRLYSLGYSFVGVLVTGVVLSIAELRWELPRPTKCIILTISSALLPLSGAIIRHAEHFVDPALSFAQSWNVIYASMLGLPAELTAAAVIVQFWSTINSAIWITVFGLLVVGSNLLFVRIYGETEFTFATLKILLIVGLNIMVRLTAWSWDSRLTFL